MKNDAQSLQSATNIAHAFCFEKKKTERNGI